jgi:uncharacterized protein YecE (DUF72 family)
MDGRLGKLRIGTCSWNYESWPIYSVKQNRAADYLSEYCLFFDTAEIDSWFYRPPDERTVKDYDLNTPDSFVFTAKVPSILTRPVIGDVPNDQFLNPDTFNTLVGTVRGLGKKLGVLIFQFEYMNLLKMAGLDYFLSSLERFLAQVDRSFPVAVETRNGNYLTDGYFSFLSNNNVIPVLSQKIYMPDIGTVWEKLSKVKIEKAVIRLLGDDRQEMEKKAGGKWNALIEEKPEKSRIAEMVHRMQEAGIEIFMNINNHYEGSAVITAEYFRREFSPGAQIIF